MTARLGRLITRLGLSLMGVSYRRWVMSGWDRVGRQYDILVPAWESDPFVTACDLRADMAAGKPPALPPGWAVVPATRGAAQAVGRKRTHSAAAEPTGW